jgi:hypothetical protein
MRNNTDSNDNLIQDKRKSGLNTSLFYKRMVLCLILCVILFIFNIGLINIPSQFDDECLLDNVFTSTYSITKYLAENKSLKNGLIISSSMFIDILFLIICFQWALFNKSYRVLLVFIKYFLIRGIIQAMFQMPFCKERIFGYPGFPSLVVSYLKTNDYYYSGHTGFPLIIGQELSSFYQKPWIYFVCLFIACVEGFILVLMQAHYGIDIFGAFIFAHYCFRITDKYIHYIDNSKIGQLFVNK